ncbi:MAG: hypothetical protein M3Y42_10015 [Actinomycetota bacterium]|nr:hypothetical protein [Actinomycetota bacterium]MDQ2957287.1 hypothetical protein [Actinomycetota bacterium]
MKRTVPSRTLPRLTGFVAALLALLGIVLWYQPAHAAAPLDHRSTAPNHPSELPGSGYLLTDPLQGASRAYWAGAYRTIAGQRSYCIDDFYDYPNPSYHYVAPEVSSWAGRPGSNNGAGGHTAQRIIWIVNSYGQSTVPATDAAVSMAINLLTGSAPFLRSYDGYFRRQLAAINPMIPNLVHQLVNDSDRYAEPYSTRLAFGAAPAVGGPGTFTVQVRSARGVAIPAATFQVTATAGLRLVSPATGRTGPTGVATVRYTALRAGPILATAQGTQLPNTTMRLGYSPSHNGANFRTGSQRVALVSKHRLTTAPPGSGRTIVTPPSIRTTVQAGNAARPVGAMVSDLVTATGLIPGAAYQLKVILQDGSALTCGSATSTVHADAHGRLAATTPGLAACGGGRDTFSEQLLDTARDLVVTSPPGQPSETFPITPVASTAVVGGVGSRPLRSRVSDRVTATGLPLLATYHVRATLRDTSGRLCGTTAGPARSDIHGQLNFVSDPLPACGQGTDTFTESISDSSAVVVASTVAGQPTETFPVRPPPAVGRPSPPPTPKPAAKRPVSTPVPRLASTGSAPTLALVGGLFSVAAGALLLLAGRRGR